MGHLRLMAKYPSLFAGASGLSSITCLSDLMPFLPREERVYFGNKFGPEQLITYLRKEQGNDFHRFGLIAGLKTRYIPATKSSINYWIEEGIPHTFEAFEGGHNNDYWSNNIGKTLTYFNLLGINK